MDLAAPMRMVPFIDEHSDQMSLLRRRFVMLASGAGQKPQLMSICGHVAVVGGSAGTSHSVAGSMQ